jgi:hypothetical protein
MKLCRFRITLSFLANSSSCSSDWNGSFSEIEKIEPFLTFSERAGRFGVFTTRGSWIFTNDARVGGDWPGLRQLMKLRRTPTIMVPIVANSPVAGMSESVINQRNLRSIDLTHPLCNVHSGEIITAPGTLRKCV